MIKDNQKVFNRLLVIIDALITAVSFVLAYYIKFYILNDGPGIGVLPVQDYYMLLPFIVPGYMFLYYRCSVYSPKRTVRRRHEIYSILQANTIGLAALIIILYMIIREINFSRSVMAIFYVLNVFLTSVFRIIMRKALRSIRKKGYNLKHILLVGYSRAAEEYIDREMSGALSGGEAKRIEIATVLARNVKLSVFDEPEAGIDLWSFSRLVETFEEIRNGTTGSLVIISHQERILSIADEIIVVADGTIRTAGPREEVLPKLLGGEYACRCPQRNGGGCQ